MDLSLSIIKYRYAYNLTVDEAIERYKYFLSVDEIPHDTSLLDTISSKRNFSKLLKKLNEAFEYNSRNLPLIIDTYLPICKNRFYDDCQYWDVWLRKLLAIIDSIFHHITTAHCVDLMINWYLEFISQIVSHLRDHGLWTSFTVVFHNTLLAKLATVKVISEVQLFMYIKIFTLTKIEESCHVTMLKLLIEFDSNTLNGQLIKYYQTTCEVKND